ncbi:MAG TPA: hypothetical protein VL137_12800 [Polyangiaceae bacterium]|jgi:hypothetical protein|nr:hypothetical protein [Polyangiaceae bacterium]
MRALAVAGVIAALSGVCLPMSAAEPPVAANELPLAPLPKAPALAPTPATPSDLAAIDDLLARLSSKDADARKLARNALDHASDALIPAAAERMRRIADHADKSALKELWTSLHTETDDDAQITGEDALDLLLSHSDPQNAAWRDLVCVMGLSRFFTTVGSVSASRQIVNIYVRFGEFLRIDTQRQLEKLDLRSAAALIEASRHPATKIAEWAQKELRRRHLSDPSRLVQLAQGEILADVLRAYGYTRDADRAKLVISFAGSSQTVIRLAAREATATLGEMGNWPLRDAYETIVGKRASREWSWERTARELFRELDSMRMHDVLSLYNAGIAAHNTGALADMRRDFDRVLALEPSFEGSGLMAQGYFDYALANADHHATDAADSLHRALRLASDDSLKRRIQSLLNTLQGKELLASGIADQVLFQRAVQLDGNNTRAKDLLEEIDSASAETPSPMHRYAAPGVLGVLAAIAVFVLLRRRVEPPPTPGTPQRQAEADAGQKLG